MEDDWGVINITYTCENCIHTHTRAHTHIYTHTYNPHLKPLFKGGGGTGPILHIFMRRPCGWLLACAPACLSPGAAG